MTGGVVVNYTGQTLPSDVTHTNLGCLQVKEVGWKKKTALVRGYIHRSPDLGLKYLVPFDPCWQFMRNMQNCSWISFSEWINHNPKRQFTPTFNILRAFSDDSDKPLFRAMPLSQIIVLCFSMTLWRNGAPGLEKQLITWIVAWKWTMTEEPDWIPIGCGGDCLFVLRCWLSRHVPRPLCQTNSRFFFNHWIDIRRFITWTNLQRHALGAYVAPCGLSGSEPSFWVTEQQNSEIGVNWGLDPIISLSVWVFVSEWVHAWLKSL